MASFASRFNTARSSDTDDVSIGSTNHMVENDSTPDSGQLEPERFMEMIGAESSSVVCPREH